MEQLRRLWHGELALESAFWNWAVIGGLIVNIASSALFLLLIADERVIAALILGYVVSVPYNLVVLVGVWRAADRYAGERRWADLARMITAVGMIVLSVT